MNTDEIRKAVGFVPVTSIDMQWSEAEAAKFDSWLAGYEAEVRKATLEQAAEDFYAASAAGVVPVLNRAAGDILMRRAKAGTSMPKLDRPAPIEGASA